MASSGRRLLAVGAAFVAAAVVVARATGAVIESEPTGGELARSHATEIGLAGLASNERRLGRRIAPARVLRATHVEPDAAYPTSGSRLTFPEAWWALEVEGTVLDNDCVPFTSRRCRAGSRGVLVVPDRRMTIRATGFGLFLQSRIAERALVEQVPLYQFRQVPSGQRTRARSERDAIRLARLYAVENARSLGRSEAPVSVSAIARLAAGGLYVVDESTGAGFRATRPTWVLEVIGTLATCTPVPGHARTGVHECRVSPHGYVAIPDDAAFPRAVTLAGQISVVRVGAGTVTPGCEITGGGRLHCRGLP